jgi:bifunctional enzyme CysN/CysC
MDLVRVATAGSVDDGKSTLIGRLLYDSKQILEDTLEAVEKSSTQRGYDYMNLALLTDGLRAEREQGITIDVAYRYFTTARRKFILADTPGHIQYTRNMVTGASTADVALVLVDARKGLLEQSRRHAFLATLLRVPHIAVCVNKMDLVDWDQGVYEAIRDEFRAFATRLEIADLSFFPVCALHGDNIVDRSQNMPWYRGLPLLVHLEELHIASDRNLVDGRFPVQYVVRPLTEEHHDYRAYAGVVAGGVFRPGDEVVVLPSGMTTTIAGIDTFDGPVEEAFPPMSVSMRLTDDVDVSRGDMICRPGNQPEISQDIDAMVCWMADKPLVEGGRYGLKHTTRSVRAVVRDLRYRLDVTTLHRDEAAVDLGLNQVGRITIRTTAPLMYDDYHRSRSTGSFILIDEATNATVAAGMILERHS